MRLRGHFIGALTLAFISIACASVSAKGTDGAADEHAHHHAASLPTTDQLLTELFRPLPTAHRPAMTMTHKKLHAFLMEDPT